MNRDYKWRPANEPPNDERDVLVLHAFDGEDEGYLIAFCEDGGGWLPSDSYTMLFDPVAWMDIPQLDLPTTSIRCPYYSRAQGYQCDMEAGHDGEWCFNGGDGFRSGYKGDHESVQDQPSTLPAPDTTQGLMDRDIFYGTDSGSGHMGMFTDADAPDLPLALPVPDAASEDDDE